MDLPDGVARWFPVICGLLGPAFGLAKRSTWAKGPVKNRNGPGFRPTRSDFSRSDQLWFDVWSVLGPCFAKKCSAPSLGSIFLKNNFRHVRSEFVRVCSPNAPKWSMLSHSTGPSRLFWPFRSQFIPFLRPMEFCVSHMTCAFLASGIRSVKNDRRRRLIFL